MSTFHEELTELTEKERRFVIAYVSDANGHSVEAARIAEYATPEVDCTRVLGRDRVKRAIAAYYAEFYNDTNEWAAITHKRAMGLPKSCYFDDGTVNLPEVTRQGLNYLVKRISYNRNGKQIVELIDNSVYVKLLGTYLGALREQIDMNTSGQVEIQYVNDWRGSAHNALDAPHTGDTGDPASNDAGTIGSADNDAD